MQSLVFSSRRPAQRGVAWKVAALLAAIFPLCTSSTALAQRNARGVEVENMRVGFDASATPSLKASNSFKIGTWTPVWVQLRAGNERFSGFMELIAGDDDGTPTTFRMPVEVGANKLERFTAYARPGSRDPEFAIRLFDQGGRRVGGASQAVVMPLAPEAIMPDETVILTMGQPLGVDTIGELPGFKQPARTASNNPGANEITVLRVDPGSIPGRWYGFDAARAIVVDTGDRAALAAISDLRGRSLVDWVERGGHLIVAVGANWQAVSDSVLAPILPGKPISQERVGSLEALDTFAGSNKSITPPGSPAVMVTKLEGVKERGGKPLSVTSNLPLVVRGTYGFGRVTLITVDVNQRPFADWLDRSLFWVRAIDLRPQRADGSGANPAMGGGGRFYQMGISDLSSQLRAGLEQFPGVKLIPFGWVAFFIFLYILLIGPGDYFFLKKVLKRMELTWITFPTIVVTVSLVAYYAAYLLKGNDLLINKVDVVDLDQQTGLARGHTWISLFSPQNRDYSIRAVPMPLDRDPPRDAPEGSSADSAAVAAGTEVVMSWFSVPENQFAAMGNSSRRFSFGGSGYSYEPTGKVDQLENVRIPIWSTKCVTARWFGPGAPSVDSDLRQAGLDRLAGTIINRQSVPLEDAIVAFGKQVYLVGTIAPGASVNVALASNRNLSGHLKEKSTTYLSEQPWNRENLKIDRAELMLAVMFHDSGSALGSEFNLASGPLHHLDLTGQLALDRPMLVGKIKRPAARVILDKQPAPPKIDELTLVRIILPLKKS